jgi:hypothetical protein
MDDEGWIVGVAMKPMDSIFAHKNKVNNNNNVFWCNGFINCHHVGKGVSSYASLYIMLSYVIMVCLT